MDSDFLNQESNRFLFSGSDVALQEQMKNGKVEALYYTLSEGIDELGFREGALNFKVSFEFKG